ncbi:MAG: exo-alpha-sialidase [Nitratireductor sp.]
MAADLSILVGTTKGAFVIIRESVSGEWVVRGPYCDGWPINHMIGDRETGDLWAGGGNDWHGAGIWRSVDGGESWQLSKLSKGQVDEWAANDPEMAKMFGWTPPDTKFDGEVTAIWSLAHAHGRLLAGGKPGKLYSSADGGVNWEAVNGFNKHPTREEWIAGAAGLVLHTIVPDPGSADKIWLGISSAGVFATEDGGKSWERRNRLANGETCSHHDHPAAPRDGQTGLCVHNMVRAPGKDGDRLYQQNHHGVFRSPDGGRSWQDITDGLPSTFGFPVAVHPHDPETVWVIPLNGDRQGRYPPDASAAVWRSRDGGASWQPLREGLPQKNCHFTVLRQAMATDRGEQGGIYFGTNTGSVFASEDNGDHWDEIARHLPTILCVEALDRR